MHAYLIGCFAQLSVKPHVVYMPPSDGFQVPTFTMPPFTTHTIQPPPQMQTPPREPVQPQSQ